MKEQFLHLVSTYWPVFMAVVGWPVVSAALNVMLYKKTPEQWEAWAMQKPLLALLVEVLVRGWGLNLTKALPALQRYSERKAGQLPASAPVSMHVPKAVLDLLQNPEAMKKLEVEAAKIVESLLAKKPN